MGVALGSKKKTPTSEVRFVGQINSFVIERLICGDLFRGCVDMAVLHIYGTIVGRLNPQEFYQLNNSAVLMNKNYLLLLDL